MYSLWVLLTFAQSDMSSGMDLCKISVSSVFFLYEMHQILGWMQQFLVIYSIICGTADTLGHVSGRAA